MVDSVHNSKIALYRFAHESTDAPPIILTHGTFSNASICHKLAEFLHSEGFDCWIYEWSGHGKSLYGNFNPDAEDHALFDVPLVLNMVLSQTGKKSCMWIGHSGGGFMPLMYISRKHSNRQNKFRLIVTIGSQASGAGKTLIGKLRILALSISLFLFNKIPSRFLQLGPEDETKGFMPQWCRWNWSGNWSGKDSFNYMEAMKKITIPALCISGSNDIVAPPEGCNELFRNLSSSNKKYLVCSQETGFSENYNHARLIASQNSRKEIWPIILDFIRQELKYGND